MQQKRIGLSTLLMALAIGWGVAPVSRASGEELGVLVREFIFETAPFRECHASTLLPVSDGLLAAWFAGTREGHPDVGIWLARRQENGWTAPEEVANGVQEDGRRFPCWNPVLTRTPSGKLLLFYKVGPSPSQWWGMVRQSDDEGRSWSAARRLPDGILGPIKNKPVWLPGGHMLCGSSTEHDGWRVHMEWSTDEGQTWQKTDVLNPGDAPEAIQPTILRHGPARLQILCRSRRAGRIVQAWSEDGGRSWSPLEVTGLPNPNSGIDAVTLDDGRHLLVYNHTPRGRTPLNVVISEDGRLWRSLVTLESEPGEYSYPAVIQAPSGKVHITYTWKRRRIAHVVVDPALARPGEPVPPLP